MVVELKEEMETQPLMVSNLFTFWDGIDNHIQKIKLIPSSECNIGQTWDRMVDRVFKLSTVIPMVVKIP